MKTPWKTSRIYGTTRAVGYVLEAEHQDGDEYWSNFPTLADAVEDFKEYREALK